MVMVRLPNSILLLLLLVVVSPLNADVVKGLYTALVPVEDHSEKERNRALRQGLQDVLVKLTGTLDIKNQPAVRRLVSDASQYVVAFGYKNLPQDNAGQGLEIRYSESDIDGFMRQQQLPVWPARRPALLVWVVTETPGEGQKLTAREESPEVYDELDALFSARGLPVRYPLLDLQDQLTLSVEDAWGLDVDPIARASERYNASGWLMVRAYQTATLDWKSAWMLSLQDEDYFNEVDGVKLDETLAKIANQVVDRVAAKFTYVPSNKAGQVAVRVSNISDFSDYSSLVALLRGLSMVSDVSVVSVDKTSVEFNLAIQGDVGPMLETLALSQKVSMPDVAPAPGSQIDLAWR
jgi:uncharacterized protein